MPLNSTNCNNTSIVKVTEIKLLSGSKNIYIYMIYRWGGIYIFIYHIDEVDVHIYIYIYAGYKDKIDIYIYMCTSKLLDVVQSQYFVRKVPTKRYICIALTVPS